MNVWIILSIIAGGVLAIFYTLADATSQVHGRGYERFFMASIFLNGLFLPFVPWDLPRHWVLIGMGAGFGYGLAGVLFYNALRYADALTAGIIIQLMPTLVMVPSWLFFGEQLTVSQGIAFAVVLIGITAASMTSARSRSGSLRGVFLLLLSVSVSAAMYVITKRLQVDGGMTAEQSFLLIRAGLLAIGLSCLALPSVRTRMWKLFSLGRGQVGYFVSEFVAAVFFLFAVAAIGRQPVGMNTALVNVVYLGTFQIALFGYYLFNRRTEHLAMKALCSVLIFCGMAYLVLSR